MIFFLNLFFPLSEFVADMQISFKEIINSAKVKKVSSLKMATPGSI
jgi:hypothetical protein